MNKIVQPVTRGFYWVILALLAVGTLVSLIAVPVSATSYEITPGTVVYSGHGGLATPNVTMIDCITSIDLDMPEAWGMAGATQSFPARLNDAEIYLADASFSMVADDYSSYTGHVTSHMDFTNWQTANMTSGLPKKLVLEPIGATNTTYGWICNNGSAYDPANVAPPFSSSIPFLAWGEYGLTIPYKTLTITTSGSCGGTTFTPTCSFTATPTSGIVPLLVSFTSTSTGAASAYWEVLDNSTGLPVLATSGLVFQNYIVGANKQYDINYSATNAYGNCVLFAPQHITTYGVGGVTTWVQAVDGLTSGAIHGSDIQIKDAETGIWVNVTNDQDGTSSITTNTTATIDAYAQATGYTSTSRTGLVPADVVYELIMWPSTAFLDPGIGNVNLAIIVNDKLTTAPIQSASVAVTIPSGATTGGSTNAAGTETFVVPNMSVIHVTVKKTGYTTASTTITTSAFGPDTKRIELVKATVTPTITATPLPGEATVRPTLDTRTGNQKDSDMMEQIRDSGPMLIQLAILATIVGLGKLMIK